MAGEPKNEIALFVLAIAFNAGLYVMALRQIKRDVNGLGRKQRSMMAEQIIALKDSPEFPAIVRRLINGA